MVDKEKIKYLLKKYNQEKILLQLEKKQDEELIEQILKINFEEIEQLKNEIDNDQKQENKEVKLEKITYIDKDELTKEERKKCEKIGENIISQGKYAVVTMAGGQRYKTWI